MRRPITLNHPAKASAQTGFALFIVLMIMIVIALLVVTATQSYNTEQRISTNDADHKFATTLAEAALREGENHIYEIEDGKKPFTDDCADGLCKAAQVSKNTYATAAGTITVNGTSSVEAWIREDDKCINSENRKKTKYKQKEKIKTEIQWSSLVAHWVRDWSLQQLGQFLAQELPHTMGMAKKEKINK